MPEKQDAVFRLQKVHETVRGVAKRCQQVGFFGGEYVWIVRKLLDSAGWVSLAPMLLKLRAAQLFSSPKR